MLFCGTKRPKSSIQILFCSGILSLLTLASHPFSDRFFTSALSLFGAVRIFGFVSLFAVYAAHTELLWTRTGRRSSVTEADAATTCSIDDVAAWLYQFGTSDSLFERNGDNVGVTV